MTFCFDENFPSFLPAALRLFGYNAEAVVDHFGRGSDDPDLFPQLASRGWIWVSHDKGIKKKPHERQAFVEARMGAFIFTGRVQRRPTEMMIFVLRHIDEMIRLAGRTALPYIYGVSDKSKIERLD